MACRLPSFVSLHAHIITKRTKKTKDLKFKKMKEIWIMLSGACIWLENIWHGHAVKTKTGMKNRNFFKKKSEFFTPSSPKTSLQFDFKFLNEKSK